MLFCVTFSIFVALNIIQTNKNTNQLNLNAMKNLIKNIIEDAIIAYDRSNPYYWATNWYKHTIAPFLRGELAKAGFTLETLIYELTHIFYYYV